MPLRRYYDGGSNEPYGSIPKKKDVPVAVVGKPEKSRFARLIRNWSQTKRFAIADFGTPNIVLLEWAEEDDDYVVIREDADATTARNWLAIPR